MNSSRNQDGEGTKPIGECTASVSPQRRRLIKGIAAAAPGIFTLYGGNAQAMLSTWQCTAHSQAAFTGEQEFAGENHLVDGFVRLAEGPGIHVVWTEPDESDEIEDEIEHRIEDEFEDEFEDEVEDLTEALSERETKDNWLIMVMDNAGISHYIEAGFVAENSGNVKCLIRPVTRRLEKNGYPNAQVHDRNQHAHQQIWIHKTPLLYCLHGAGCLICLKAGARETLLF